MKIPGDRVDRALCISVVFGAALLLVLKVVAPRDIEEETRGRSVSMARVAASVPPPESPGKPPLEEVPPSPAAEIGTTNAGAMEEAGPTPEKSNPAEVVTEGPQETNAAASTTPGIDLGADDLSHDRLDALAAELARGDQRWPVARAAFSMAAAHQALSAIGGRILVVSADSVELHHELVGGLSPRALRVPKAARGPRLLFPIPDAPRDLYAFVETRWPPAYGRPLLAWEPPQEASDRALAVVAIVLRSSGFSPDSLTAVAGEWKTFDGQYGFFPIGVDHVRLGRTPVTLRDAR